MDFGGYIALEQMSAITPEQLNDLAKRFTAETGKKAVTSYTIPNPFKMFLT